MGIRHGIIRVAFGTVEPLGQKSDRLFHAARQIERASLALFNAGNDIAHSLGDRGEVDSNTFSLRSLCVHLRLRLRCGVLRKVHRVATGVGYVRIRHPDFVSAAIHDDLIEPCTKRHACTACGLLCSFARFRLNAFDAPWNTRSHTNHCLLTVSISIGHNTSF